MNGARLAMSDATSLLVSIFLGVSYGWLWSGTLQIGTWAWTLPAGWMLGAHFAGLYPGWGRGRLDELRRMLQLFTAVVVIAAAITVLAGDALSAPFYAACGAVLAILTPLRARTRLCIQDSEDWGMPVVVYGAGDTAARTIGHLRNEPGLGLRPVAVVDDDPARVGRLLEGFDVLGRAGDRIPAAPAALVAMPDSERRDGLVERLTAHYEQVIVLTGALDRVRLLGHACDFDGVLGVALTAKLGRTHARRLKRGTELALIFLAAPVWAPLLAVLAAAVWLEDRHAPFLRQERVACDGTPYAHIRLRSVVPNPGERLRKALQEDTGLRQEWETRFRLENDPRVTRVGAVLRRFGLEGLPQIIQVVRGRMALVGAQPLPPYRHLQPSRAAHESRGTANPGMTGLWKVYGDREEDASETYYVREWSVWLDLAVLMEQWVERVTPQTSVASPRPRRPSTRRRSG